jgi:thiamine biosynthesis protein ThiS
MQLTINGQAREIELVPIHPHVADLLKSLELKGDRVAVEQNGLIVSRGEWASAEVNEGDKFEIVHFVGGGVA